MKKLVVLKLDGGSEQGVRVALEIGEEGERPNIEVTGQLPGATDLVTAVEQWQSTYRSFGKSERIKAKKVVYVGSITKWCEDCQTSAVDLRKRLNNWLLSESFRLIRETWLQQLSPSDEVRLLIRTSSVPLRKLPWHLWDLVEDYPLAEVAYSAPEAEQSASSKTPTYRDKVRILAILGNSTGINVQKDRQLLENLPDAAVTFLVEPQRKDINDQLWNQSWDILFFAGHSKTEGNTGRIYINQTDSLTIAELRYGLRNAVANGLQLAIFNSCDGLGLALELEQLHIGQMIVMREPVPDRVAQTFLTYFLAAFASGKSFYLAEREARLKLQGLEDEFPCASWLPVIFQNPAAVPPMWQDLGRRPTQVCPYRGLFAFREEDAPFFYGRGAFIQMLVEAVQKQSLVAVIGPSGSGKSSVVFAGLIPQLRSERTWLIEAFRPGDRPFRNLAAKLVPLLETQMSETDQLLEINKLAKALRQGDLTLRDAIARILEKNSGDRFLLVVDQFEELYTLCRDARERLLFLDNLLEASDRTPNFTLVLTLRADFLGQALSYRPFGDALQYADLKLSPMNREELQAAVEQPAAMLGVTIESGLTQRILEAVSAQAGDLPLLEFALNQLWAKQRDAQLTHAAYEEIGGVEAALSRYAEEAYGRLNEEEKERARRIFIQLVRPGEGTEDTRRLATRTEVGEENWDLVTRLASARLVVSSRDEAASEETVEIVHEALIGGWERLRLWIEVDRSFRIWQERLRASMRQWEASGRDEGALLRGVPLAEAEGWLQSRAIELSPVERSFIEQSAKTRSRQRRRLVFGLSVGLVGALALAGIAGLQWQRAEKQRQKALARELAVQAAWTRNLGANRLPHSILLAVEAMQRFPTLEAEQALRQGLALLPHSVAHHNNLVSGFIPVFYWDKPYKHTPTVVFNPNRRFKIDAIVTFSPDKRYKAVLTDDYIAIVWDVNSSREVGRIKLDTYVVRQKMNLRIDSRSTDIHTAMKSALALSPNGQYLVTASKNPGIAPGLLWHIWKVTNGREVARIQDSNHDYGTGSIPFSAFSLDGRYLATTVNYYGSRVSDNYIVHVWEVNSGREVVAIKFKDKTRIHIVSFSPDGRYLATTSDDNTVRVWEVMGGRFVARLTHKDWVSIVSFSPDGRYLATASDDKIVRVWEVSSGREVSRLSHEAGLTDVAFSPDGKYLATAIDSGNIYSVVRVWEVISRREVVRLPLDSQVQLLTFSSDGQYLTTVSFQGSDGQYLTTVSFPGFVRVGETTRGQRFASLTHESPVRDIAFSPNGRYLVTASSDNTVWVWEVSSSRLVTRLKPRCKKLCGIAFTQDGQYLATISRPSSIESWNTLQSSYPFPPMYIKPRELFTVQLWEPSSGRQVTPKKNFNLDGIVSRFRVVKPSTSILSPHRKYLTAPNSSHSDVITVWDVLRGRLVAAIIHDDQVNALAFSPDEKYLASASKDKTVRVKEIISQREVAHLIHDAGVTAVAFSPDGQYLATASQDKIVRVQPWRREALIAEACTRLKRNLTKGEWDSYLLDEPYRKTCPNLPTPEFAPPVGGP